MIQFIGLQYFGEVIFHLLQFGVFSLKSSTLIVREKLNKWTAAVLRL